MTPLQCGNCGQAIPEGIHPYTMRIEFFPRVEESLEISEADFDVDFDEEIKKIVNQLEAMGEEEVELQEAKVYSSFSFVLCGTCRDLLASQLRRNMPAT